MNTWSWWRLVSVNKSQLSTWSDDVDVTFRRMRLARRAGHMKVEHRTIVIESDGVTKIYNGATIQRVKPHKREKLHGIACQAVAFVHMGGEVEDFPEQETL